ncbi:MAG TPA: YhjD/YihY/BrkB family envelope integrity protein [Thermoanaerobaculia bacterium]
MADDPRDPESRQPGRFAQRFISARDTVWSWLTDPAVLVYRRAAFGRHRARVLVVEFFLVTREIAREFYEMEGTSRAASLAYTTLLSLVPLLVALTQVVQQYFRKLFPGWEAQVDNILNIVLPYQSPQITYNLAKFAQNAQAASTLGAIVFMVIAFRLFLAVETTINQIWKVRYGRGYRQKLIAFTMLFFWGPLLMGLSFTTNKTLQRNPYLHTIFKHDIVFVIAPIVILFIAFTMLFWLVPATRVQFSAAVVGALVTTMLFSLVRWGFGIYADHLFHGRFNLIYGTVGLALIFLVAIEVMWVVILLGVEISYVYQNLYGVLRAQAEQIDDDARFDLYFALRAVVEIARRFDRREDSPSSYRLAEQFGTTDAQMLRVLSKLEDGKLVKSTGGEYTGYVPGCDPDRISVEEIVAHVEGSLRVLPDQGPDDEERRVIGGMFTRMNESTAAALNRMTIGRMVRDLYSPRAIRNDDRIVRES